MISKEDYYENIYELYQTLYATSPDEYIEKLREAVQNNLAEVSHWIEALRAKESNTNTTSGTLDSDFLNYLEGKEALCEYTCLCFDDEGEDGDQMVLPRDGMSLGRMINDPQLREAFIKALSPESIQKTREDLADIHEEVISSGLYD